MFKKKKETKTHFRTIKFSAVLSGPTFSVCFQLNFFCCEAEILTVAGWVSGSKQLFV